MVLSTSIEPANIKLSAEMRVSWLISLVSEKREMSQLQKVETWQRECVHSKSCSLYWINFFALSKRMHLLRTSKLQTLGRSFALRQMENVRGRRDVEIVHTCIILLTYILF